MGRANYPGQMPRGEFTRNPPGETGRTNGLC
jgi:hypothetical protein